MARRLTTLMSAASLVLCVATCSLWWRSRDRHDWAQLQWGGGPEPDGSRFVSGWDVISRPAWVEFACGRTHWAAEYFRPGDDRLRPTDYQSRFFVQSHRTVEGPTPGRPLLGPVRTDGWSSPSGGSYAAVFMPHWLLAAATAVPPAGWLTRRRRRRLRAARGASAGLCPACGYDLRASLGRCPECGAIPKEGPAA